MLKSDTNLKQRLFLDAYAQFGNISAAAQMAKVTRQSHHSWLEEPEYAAAFAEVQEVAEDMLSEEARRLAVEGVERPVLYRGKVLCETRSDPKTGGMRPTNKPVTIRRYSDTLLMFLLKVQRPALPRIPDYSRLSNEDLEQLCQLKRKAEGLPALPPPTQ